MPEHQLQEDRRPRNPPTTNGMTFTMPYRSTRNVVRMLKSPYKTAIKIGNHSYGIEEGLPAVLNASPIYEKEINVLAIEEPTRKETIASYPEKTIVC